MIITKENETIYINRLIQAVIDFHKESNFTMTFVIIGLSKDDEEKCYRKKLNGVNAVMRIHCNKLIVKVD